MIPVPTGVRVWLATGHTDMRKGFGGLSLLVPPSPPRSSGAPPPLPGPPLLPGWDPACMSVLLSSMSLPPLQGTARSAPGQGMVPLRCRPLTQTIFGLWFLEACCYEETPLLTKEGTALARGLSFLYARQLTDK